MLLIPTIGLRHRQVVVPTPNSQSVLPTDPHHLAEHFAHAGCEMLQLIDYDAPAAGDPAHGPLIQQIIQAHGFHCQLGGPIRSADVAARYLDYGVARIIAGTPAYQDPEFARALGVRCPNRWGVEIHLRDDQVVIKGWTVAKNKSALDYAEHFRALGARCLLVSAVNPQGAIDHDSLQRIRELALHAHMPILHGTDLTTMDDLAAVMRLEKFGVMGAILGSSLYDGRFDLSALVTLAKAQETQAASDETTLLSDEDAE